MESSLPLKPGRYCQHGAVVPGAAQLLALAAAKEAEKIAVCIDWCDECMGFNRKVAE